MAIQKKHGKGRLDKWYRLAKEKGYRARSAFKLVQLNKKYNFLEKSKVLIDLCAAPGSWCQVAAEVMPPNSLIIGVDLTPIKAIPRCITFQGDITSDKTRAIIRQHLKTWKADTVLHDGAPNVGAAWVQDAFSQAELVLQSLKLATVFLAEGGTFVTKVFRSKDYNPLLWVFNQLFTKVEATKPPSSRNISAEIFVVCRGYKAPKHVDPKFLDPRTVFAELSDPTPNNEAKVYNPEKKKRKRDGYEEGNWTQYKEVPASDFIQATDPIAMLANLNKFTFEQGSDANLALATLDRLPETNEDIRICCADLRVLGRKEFRILLKWRLRVREIFGLSSKTKAEPQGEEVAEVAPMDEELQMQEEMQRLRDQGDKKKKKERRRENEKKQKEVVRMQLNMQTPMELGLEQDIQGEGMFGLKAVDGAGLSKKIAKGRMHIPLPADDQKKAEAEQAEDEDEESDPEEDALERSLDDMYDDYQGRMADRDAKFRAKKARKEREGNEWHGFEEEEEEEVEDSDDQIQVEEEDSDSSDEEDEPRQLVTDLDQDAGKTEGGLTRRAAMFFEQDIFKGLDFEGGADEDSGIDVDSAEPGSSEEAAVSKSKQGKPAPSDSDHSEDASEEDEQEDDEHAESSDDEPDNDKPFELVKHSREDWESEVQDPKTKRPNIDIITAEAMTLAHQLATGQKTKETMVDDGFNKFAFRDVDGLPDWFLDDEGKHSKLLRPITAEASAAIREKLRALNARPIKKVREAKARKKFKAAQRLEKLKKKSALLMEEEGVSERDKAQEVQKLMAKAAKKKPKRDVKVVVARGGNKAISGRPKGTKGRYKMVDARMRKDVRGLKRAAAKQKKR
ncbi:Spb1 domain-containing protein [Eremomyces bilateralis CBS 781.70]|uniref:Spb1 domain-containing protein n=1 Tax=Eremomyces bilateralis CBS 781.70 TaxID=1392243 RepID=A0A6G1GB15_9PEZI|nr:Spb1 domain-containing protein [Eremomyces bilateralis CBS 781.70]KAF1815101.1 Spb1 domain-containing protein [Eremomyces bilateralis CBS 781.70]